MPEELRLRFKRANPSESLTNVGYAQMRQAWRKAEKAMPRRDAVDKIAGELGRSPRQVQRYLAQLVKAGKAPVSWFDGYQYKPDPSEAAALIRREVATVARRAKRKGPETDSWDADILKLHAQRNQAVARLRKEEEKRRWLSILGDAHAEQWARRQTVRFDLMDIAEIMRFRVEAAEMAREVVVMSRYGMKGWMLQIAFYHARASESPQPVEHVCQLLKISPSTFWRKFGHNHCLMKTARDGGDAYFAYFASGGSPAQMMEARPVAPLPISEMPEASSAWDAQFYVASAGRERGS